MRFRAVSRVLPFTDRPEVVPEIGICRRRKTELPRRLATDQSGSLEHWRKAAADGTGPRLGDDGPGADRPAPGPSRFSRRPSSYLRRRDAAAALRRQASASRQYWRHVATSLTG